MSWEQPVPLLQLAVFSGLAFVEEVPPQLLRGGFHLELHEWFLA